MVTILLVLIIGKTIGMLDFFSLPSDDGTYVQDNNPVGQIMRILSKILFGFQIGLLCLLHIVDLKLDGITTLKKNTKYNKTYKQYGLRA
ncbi:hypothetical protein Q2T40_00440 [Winogradskyella maritima]|nr:hypothetical protein [Winogradskyella maritima]